MKKSKRDAKKRKYSDAKKAAGVHNQGFERTSLKVPADVNFFNPKKGVYRIEILPFEAGKGNPCADPGILHYERSFWVHKNIGPNNRSYVCPSESTKHLGPKKQKRCPICEHISKLRRAGGDKAVIDAIKLKHRQLFNVFDHADPEKGVQLWDNSYHLFGKLLNTKVENEDEGDNYSHFYHVEDGMTLKLTVEEKSTEDGSWTNVTDIEFKPRREDLDDDLVAKAHNLDDLIKVLEYDDLKNIFLKGEDEDDEDEDTDDEDTDDEDEDEDDEEEDEKPAKKKGKKSKDDEDDEDEDEDTDDEDEDEDDEDEDDEDEDEDDTDDDEPAFKIGHKVSFEDEDGDYGEGVIVKIDKKKETASVKIEGEKKPLVLDLDDLELVKAKKGKKTDEDDEDEDEDEDEKPTKKGKAKAKKSKDEDDEEEDEDEDDTDDDDEDEDEKPRRKLGSKGKKPAAKKGKKSKDEDDEEEEDEDDEDDDIPFDDEDDEDEDDEDEKPAKKKGKK